MPLETSRLAVGLLALYGAVLLLDAWLGAEAQAASLASDQAPAVASGIFSTHSAATTSQVPHSIFPARKIELGPRGSIGPSPSRHQAARTAPPLTPYE